MNLNDTNVIVCESQDYNNVVILLYVNVIIIDKLIDTACLSPCYILEKHFKKDSFNFEI